MKPRDMTEDAQASTHMYGVRDRLDTTSLSDHTLPPDPSEVDVDQVLPTPEDLKNNFAILISCVLKNFPSLHQVWRSIIIIHMFSEEMSQKSKVVCRSVYRYCLGVLIGNFLRIWPSGSFGNSEKV